MLKITLVVPIEGDMTASDPASFPPPRLGLSVPAVPPPMAAPRPTLTVDHVLLAASAQPGVDEFAPRMPVRAVDRPAPPAAPRPSLDDDDVKEPEEPPPGGGRHFHARRPIPDLGALIFVVMIPLALAAVAMCAG